METLDLYEQVVEDAGPYGAIALSSIVKVFQRKDEKLLFASEQTAFFHKPLGCEWNEIFPLLLTSHIWRRTSTKLCEFGYLNKVFIIRENNIHVNGYTLTDKTKKLYSLK